MSDTQFLFLVDFYLDLRKRREESEDWFIWIFKYSTSKNKKEKKRRENLNTFIIEYPVRQHVLYALDFFLLNVPWESSSYLRALSCSSTISSYQVASK